MKNNTLSKLKEKEKDARRKIILDAAEKEFAGKVFEKVTMRDIAKRAGISPALIYRHFPDQLSLFVETFGRGTKDILRRIEAIIDESSDEAIELVSLEFIDYFSKNDQYCRMMIYFFLSESIDTNHFKRLNKIEKTFLDYFDQIFIQMKFPGNIRFHSHTFFACLAGILLTFNSHPEKNNREILKHRKRITQNLVEFFKSKSP